MRCHPLHLPPQRSVASETEAVYVEGSDATRDRRAGSAGRWTRCSKTISGTYWELQVKKRTESLIDESAHLFQDLIKTLVFSYI